jgi:hypothetical protein
MWITNLDKIRVVFFLIKKSLSQGGTLVALGQRSQTLRPTGMHGRLASPPTESGCNFNSRGGQAGMRDHEQLHIFQFYKKSQMYRFECEI